MTLVGGKEETSLDPNGNLSVTTDVRDVYGGLLHDMLNTPVSDVIPSWRTSLSVHWPLRASRGIPL